MSLFGVIHFTTRRPVREELTAFAEDADAIFLEQPRRIVTVREFLSALLRAPLGVLGFLFLGLVIHAPLMIAFNRDLLATEQAVLEDVIERLDVPAHAVDEHLFASLSRRGLPTAVVNWAILGAFLILLPWPTATATCLLLVGTVPLLIRARGHRIASMVALAGWFAVAISSVVASLVSPYGPSLSLFLIAAVVGQVEVVRSVAPRNRIMLDRIEDVAASEGYDDVVHVTGKGHLGGLVRRGRERGFEVPRVHVSAWRDFGEWYEAPAPEAVPQIGDGALDGPVLVPDSERTVLRQRVVSGAQDGLIAFLFGALATCVLLLMAVELLGTEVHPLTGLVVLTAGLLGVPFVWFVVQESRGATTANKATSDLVVADAADGTAPTLRAVCLRNLLKPVDALGIGLVAMYATERNQRLGDLLAGTVVGESAIAARDDQAEPRESPAAPVAEAPDAETSGGEPTEPGGASGGTGAGAARAGAGGAGATDGGGNAATVGSEAADGGRGARASKDVKGIDEQYCTSCGEIIEKRAVRCPYCGVGN